MYFWLNTQSVLIFNAKISTISNGTVKKQSFLNLSFVKIVEKLSIYFKS